MQVIPAINANSLEEARVQLAKIAVFADTVHLDVADGTFTDNTLWGVPEECAALVASHQQPALKFEVHLMVAHPEDVIEAWMEAGASRVIVHVETVGDSEYIERTCAEHEVEAVAAVNAVTDPKQLENYFSTWQSFLVLAVTPGRPGQAFQREAVDKVRFIHERAPNATIEVDGGINPQTAALCAAAGAVRVVSASFILNSADPAAAYKLLAEI